MTKLEKDHMMILLESIDSKVQITMEAVSTLDNKIDAVRDELKEDIAFLDCKIMGLSLRVDTLDKKVDMLDKKVDTLDRKVDTLDRKVDAVDKKVDAVYEELVAHRNDTELHRQPKRTLKRVP